MGAVYKARDRLTGNTVALKQVRVSPADLQFASKGRKQDSALALALEFRTLAGLRHPNIVAVLDYGFENRQQPYFTMEYLEDARTITDYGRSQAVPKSRGSPMSSIDPTASPLC